MQNRNVGLVVAALAVVAAVALFVVLRDDEGDTETTTTQASTTTDQQTTTDQETTTDQGTTTTDEPKVATIVVKNGEPVGGVQELSFAEGEDIRFVVESDVDEEVHLHGYDIGKDVKAGGSVEFDVPATIPGVFEVELEQSVVPLAEITVE